MDLELKGKVAVVTGASVGIGLAVAQGLAKEGVQLVLCARDEARLLAAVHEITGSSGVRAVGVQADVSKSADIERILHCVEETFGGVDILINNAGTGSNETIMDAPDDKWQYLLGSARDGSGQAGAWLSTRHAETRRRRNPAERLHLCQAAAWL